MERTALARFEAQYHPEPNSGCWLWRGYLRRGYATFWFQGKNVPAHRFAYEMYRGPIPEHLNLDHACNTESCVNPSHVRPMTQRENVLRGRGLSANNARKTHCPEGHALRGDNLVFTRDGARHCRICKNVRNRLWMRAYWARKRRG